MISPVPNEELTLIDLEPVYTIEEVAAFLKVNKCSVYRFVFEKKIGHHKIGRGLRFTLKDVENYLAKTRKEASNGRI